jgi:hypothetical protein
MAKRNMFVGMDSIDISLAEDGCGGEVRHSGVIPGDLENLEPKTIVRVGAFISVESIRSA